MSLETRIEEVFDKNHGIIPGRQLNFESRYEIMTASKVIFETEEKYMQ